jgi:hypothetical protein
MTQEEYARYLQSRHWRRTRARALAKAGYQCTHMFATFDDYNHPFSVVYRCTNRKHLHVHHLTYETLWEEREADLAVLCRDCHLLEHLTCELCGDALFSEMDEAEMWALLRTECQDTYEGHMDLPLLRDILSCWPNGNFCEHCAHVWQSSD